ncbi:malectin domain-containing carbohydrate-binding protein [Croceivirga thetidis]|uniref:DUF5011 domain-containing protein n=1 Tax=Croceivirga thetidis TaxID=2721623 RepID=A0ABX1GPT7_9FLAO|nr:malectin domain-containing carbohydrate-binding protein [Croceivirga thetidis]NKI31951.1 DUF5011 domain-containing protein [Croceivirga thetidis]
MKNITLTFLFFTLMTLAGYGQKVAIVSLNHTSPDGMAIVALEDLPSGETFYYTDKEYDAANDAFEPQEVVVEIVLTSAMARGQVITISEISSDVLSFTCTSGCTGSATVIDSVNTNFSLATDGEGHYLYADDDTDPTNGITEIYCVVFTGSGENPVVNGGPIPANEDPTSDFPDAIVVDGFPASDPGFTEFNPALRSGSVSKSDLEDPANWTHGQANATPSQTPFTDIAVGGDTTPPTITCPTVSPAALDINCENALPDYRSFPTVADDMDPNPVVTQDPAPGTIHSTDIDVTLTATDASGNSASCTFTLEVIDAIAPSAVCRNIRVQLDASGNATITAADIDGGSTDNCGVTALVASKTAFTTADVGDNDVTLTVSDADNNMSTCTAIVTVEDNVAPNAVCIPSNSITLRLGLDGTASLFANAIDNGSNDASGIANLEVSPDLFTCADFGERTVTLTVTDNNGNVSFCSTIIQIDDVLPPEITCPSDVMRTSSSSLVLTLADLGTPSTLDNCNVASVVGTRSDNNSTDLVAAPFPQGVTNINYVVTDIHGLTNTCSQTVTIMPPPLVNVPNVVGLQQATAESNLLLAGLTIGTVTTANDNTVPAGNVISQNPTSGTSVAENSPVDLVVSLGPSCIVSIDTQPQDPTVCEFDSLSLSVVASGTGTLSYQWQFAAPGSSSFSDVLTNSPTVQVGATVSLGANGNQYRVIVTSDNGTPSDSSDDCSVTSDAVTLTVNPLPTVTFTAPDDLCIDAGVQTGRGGGTPAQGPSAGDSGVYSGPGVTDDGNGMTYSFDPAVAGVGVHEITYEYTDGNGCTGLATDEVEVFALPVLTFTALADLPVNAGVQTNLGGGNPVGGVYSGIGVTDNGDSTYDFDPSVPGVGTHTITYTYTNLNGCTNSASDDVVVLPAQPLCSVTIEVQPVDASLCLSPLPIGASISVTAVTNGASLSYQWEQLLSGSSTWTEIGPDSNELLFQAPPLSWDDSQYRVIVTSDNGTPADDTDDCSETSDSATLSVNELPTVTFTAPGPFQQASGIETGLGGGLPVGGVYSGSGVSDDGNGETFSFDTAFLDSEQVEVTYTFTDANGCTNFARDNIVSGIPEISIDDVVLAEGTGGTTTFVFTATLSRASANTITVDYETLDGTAVATEDYTEVEATLTFNPGETSKSFGIDVNPDSAFESDETFFIQLVDPVNAAIADNEGIGTILNDDAPAAIYINSGGGETVFDGKTFVADTNFNGGVTAANTSLAIAELFQSERNGPSEEFGYDIPLPNGEYQVTLYFAETFWGLGTRPGIGARVFDIMLEGNTVLDDYDIIADAGGAAIPIAKTFTVVVNDGQLDLDLDSLGDDGSDRPKLSGIGIVGGSGAPVNTKPVITLNGPVVVTLIQGETYIEEGATANDLEDGPIPVLIGGETVDTSTPNTYIVTYNTVDSGGLAADEVTRAVTVLPLGNPDFALRINVGGPDTVLNGDDFMADAFFDGGLASTNGSLAVPSLHQSVRTSPTQEFGYDIPLADGDYTVTLYFTETFWGLGTRPGAGSRVFDVMMEGITVLDDYDIIADIGGAGIPVTKSFAVTVTGGQLDIDLDALGPDGANQPTLSGIEIEGTGGPVNNKPVISLNGLANITLTEGDAYTEEGATANDPEDGPVAVSIGGDTVDTGTPGTYVVTYDAVDSQGLAADQVVRTVTVQADGPTDFALRINAGGPETVLGGDTFIADAFFTGGGTGSNAGLAVPELHQTERTSPTQEFGYELPLVNGQYEVTLYFTEIFWGIGTRPGVGARVFDVQLEGSTVLDDFDIVADSGAGVAVSKTFTITVLDGQFDLYLESLGSDGANQPTLSGIEIESIGTMASPLQFNTNSMSLSPNPANITSVVSFEEPEEIEQIQVFDLTGRLIQSFDAKKIRNGDTFEMDVYPIPVGTYIVRAESPSGFQYNKQMVIKR